ncbi:MAG: AMP-binding protein [Lentisphaeria bacterium]|nr:AMP-binding protein [Lentisphaeria bacterium]
MLETLHEALSTAGLTAPESEKLVQQTETLCRELAPLLAWRSVIDGRIGSGDFDVEQALHQAIFRDWPVTSGPPPAWIPADNAMERANIGALARAVGMTNYDDLHRWSVQHRDAFWTQVVERLGIHFDQAPEEIRGGGDPRCPEWFPGARMNIAASCFQADPEMVAILYQEPGGERRSVTYGELDRLSNRVANSLVVAGFRPGDALGIAMPMHPEAVAIYLGIVKAGCAAVAISEQFSAKEMCRRLRLGGAEQVFVQEMPGRGHDVLYRKLREADAPPMIVMSAELQEPIKNLRKQDTPWDDFLVTEDVFTPVAVAPDTVSHVLFSSGTTRDPKAIPWTHTTPIRGIADAWLHHDIHPGDVVAWPTSLAWMMGPWLVYAALVNRATMALFGGTPITKGFGAFVRDTGVTMLGLVPSLVRSWRQTRCMERFDWSRIRCFSSTGECSNPDDMMYLMWLADWKPVIEYCGGTEIGGGYITGTVVQSAVPGTFSTPALGLDITILDEQGDETDNGEVFLLPPSLGLSNTLLNYDHAEVYFDETPSAPDGACLRRHGDQLERLPGGHFRSHGRVDDTMNLKGIKASSAELEVTFNGVDGVQETAAIAMPPPGGGPSQLVVYAVLEPDVEADPKQLRLQFSSELRAHHSSLFRIHDVVIAKTLPRTASNKVMRRQLREDYQARYEGKS